MTLHTGKGKFGAAIGAGLLAMAASAAAQVLPEAPPLPPVPPAPAAPAAPPAPVPPAPPRITQAGRIIVMDHGDHARHAMANESEIERYAMAQAIAGIRSARESIADNRALSDEVRREILQELDAEIAKLQVRS